MSRSDYFNQVLALTIADTSRAANVWKFSTKIRKQLHDQPDTATLRVHGFTPHTGQPIIIANGSIDNRLFAGTIMRVRQESVRQAAVSIHTIEAVDWTWTLSNKLVVARYTDTAAHTIVQDLIATYAPGFTSTAVQLTAPVIDEITFSSVPLSSALARVAQRVGWRWFPAPDKVIHFFSSETAQAPVPLTPTNYRYKDFDWGSDLSQVRTRVFVEGGGGSTTAPVTVGSLSIPVDECGWYSASGGQLALPGPQLVTYTGRSASSGPGALNGVPASGAGAIVYAVLQGQPVNLLVRRDDASAQSVLATLTGGDGIVEEYITDNRLGLVEATRTADAELSAFAAIANDGTYWTTDKQADVGRSVAINLPSRGIATTIPITSVEISYVAHEQWQRNVTLDSTVRLDLIDALNAASRAS